MLVSTFHRQAACVDQLRENIKEKQFGRCTDGHGVTSFQVIVPTSLDWPLLEIASSALTLLSG
jgi:hypothetical protein